MPGDQSWPQRASSRLAIAAFFIFYAYTTALWLSIDHRPPRSDESVYLQISLYSYRQLQTGHPIAALDLKTVTNTKPGGVEFLSALTYFIVGQGEHTAIFLVNVTSMMLTAISLLWMSTLFYRTLAPGLVAFTWLISLTCTIVWSGYYQIDIPLMAVSTFTIALCVYLTKTGFTDRRAAIALMLTIAFGLTVKHMYAAFAGPSVVLLTCLGLFTGEKNLRERLRERAFPIGCIIAGAFIGLLYHVLNRHIVIEQVHRAFHPPDQGAIEYETSLVKEFGQLIPDYTWLHIVLFAVGLALTLRASRRLLLFPLLLMACGWYGVSISTQQPWSYYLFPILPSFGLIAASVLAWPELNNRNVRTAAAYVTAALVIFFVSVYLKRHLGTANPMRVIEAATCIGKPKAEVTSNPMVDKDYWDVDYLNGSAATLPYPLDWKQDEIVAFIGSIVSTRNTPAPVGLVTRSEEWFNDYNIGYALYKAHLEKKAPLAVGTPLALVKTPDDIFNMGDILIFREPKPFSAAELRNPWTKPALAAIKQVTANDWQMVKANGYLFGKAFALPEHSTAYIWYKPDDGTIKLMDMLSDARISPARDNAAFWLMKCAGEERRVLFEHPVRPPDRMTIAWQVHVKAGARLKFGIGMSQDVWDPSKGDGVEFQILVTKDGHQEQLFSNYIDPKNNPADRKWFDYDLPLSVTHDQDIGIKLVTLPGPRGDITSDHAGWSDLHIVY